MGPQPPASLDGRLCVLAQSAGVCEVISAKREWPAEDRRLKSERPNSDESLYCQLSGLGYIGVCPRTGTLRPCTLSRRLLSMLSQLRRATSLLSDAQRPGVGSAFGFPSAFGVRISHFQHGATEIFSLN